MLRGQGQRAVVGRSARREDFTAAKMTRLAERDRAERERRAAIAEVVAHQGRFDRVRLGDPAREVLLELYAAALAAGVDGEPAASIPGVAADLVVHPTPGRGTVATSPPVGSPSWGALWRSEPRPRAPVPRRARERLSDDTLVGANDGDRRPAGCRRTAARRPGAHAPPAPAGRRPRRRRLPAGAPAPDRADPDVRRRPRIPAPRRPATGTPRPRWIESHRRLESLSRRSTTPSGSKGQLLCEVVEATAAGGDRAAPVAQRAWAQQMLAATTGQRVLALAVENGADIYVRASPLWAAVAAASADPQVEQYWKRVAADRRTGQSRMVVRLCRAGCPPPGPPPTARPPTASPSCSATTCSPAWSPSADGACRSTRPGC